MQTLDRGDELLEQVREAITDRRKLNIVGGNSKWFLGQAGMADPLSVTAHRGIISYEPTELVVSVHSGTPVIELESVLEESGQMMPFEPPVFSGKDTIGGVIACGLSGPRRPYAGSARDFVLGIGIINGKGERLRFGGQVMKNVAGYDVSRLQVGAMGTLGVILDVSMKVLPRPEHQLTLQLELAQPFDTGGLIRLARQPLPVSATAIHDKVCQIRLEGSGASVEAARRTIGGEVLGGDDPWWLSLSDHTHPFFETPGSLWRISVADYAQPLPLDGNWLYEWGGAQRWLVTDLPANTIFQAAAAAGGHATRFRGLEPGAAAFQPLSGVIASLHQNLRAAFDPDLMFNPGRFHDNLPH